MKARSPNLGDYGINKHYGTGPYHKVAGFLVENEDCKMETNAFSQSSCPDENKNGFYINQEMSSDWQDLDQTQILFYHSWINEYARWGPAGVLCTDEVVHLSSPPQGSERHH